jgi:two-component system response regulator AtoC
VQVAEDIAAARRLLTTKQIDPLVVVADVQLPDGNSLDLLEALNGTRVPVGEWVVLTGFGSISDSVRALQLGAYELPEKPYGEARLDLAVASAARSARAQRTVRDHAVETARRYAPERFVGTTRQATATRELLTKVAESRPTAGPSSSMRSGSSA